MLPPELDLTHRRIAWDALSDLFLDTDMAIFRQCRAEKLAALPYSIPELEQILIKEIYPICIWNLRSIAGEWAGFDLEWLEAEILRRANSPLAILRSFNLARWTFLRSEDWRNTKMDIATLRLNLAQERLANPS